jgi:hypothetical protein
VPGDDRVVSSSRYCKIPFFIHFFAVGVGNMDLRWYASTSLHQSTFPSLPRWSLLPNASQIFVLYITLLVFDLYIHQTYIAVICLSSWFANANNIPAFLSPLLALYLDQWSSVFVIADLLPVSINLSFFKYKRLVLALFQIHAKFFEITLSK